MPREIAAREIREDSNSEFFEVIDDAKKAWDIYIHLAESIDNEGLLLFANSMAEVLNSVVEGINKGDLNSLMTLYEADACFASQPGQHAKSPDGIRQSRRSFIDFKGKLDLKIKRVLQASDLALVITEWSFSGTGSDGNPVNRTAKSTNVLRQQSDGSCRFVIDNPWRKD